MTALVQLAELKEYLNYDVGDVSNDAELTRFANSASEVAEELAGKAATVTVVETHDGGGPQIVLRQRCQSVTSVVEYVAQIPFPLTEQDLASGTAFGFYGFTVDGQVLIRRSTGTPIPFAAGRRNVIVTYVAGYATVPQRVIDGVCELVRHWQRWGQESRAPGAGADDGYVSASGYAVPMFVLQLLSPQRMAPGIA